LGLREIGRVDFVRWPAQLSRWVLRATVRLLVLTGAVIGIGAGYATSLTTDVLASVIVGIASAFGAWATAALISLFIEIANSLRAIAARESLAPTSDPSE